MDKERTLNFLTTTRMSMIACADEKLLCTFFGFIVSTYDRKHENSSVESKDKDSDILVVDEMTSDISRKEIAEKLTGLIENMAEKQVFVPLKCNKYSELRSIYFRLPDHVKPEVRIFVLRETEVDVKLECELGLLQGRYILYNYDKTSGTFTEKE